MKRAAICIFVIALLSGSLVCFTQEPDNSFFYPVSQEIDDSYEFFSTEEPIDISLKFDITLFRKKKPSNDYLDATLTWYKTANDSVTSNIRLRSRGNMRYELCQFPPIRLNFKDTRAGFSELDSIGNIKLVTHCNEGKAFEEYIIKEYLVYKLYNILTDTSFRVRLARIRYIDTGKKKDVFTRYGFIIEPSAAFEKRLAVYELKDIIVRPRYIDETILDRMSMFNYMVGNSDYQTQIFHNVKAYKSVDLKNYLSIVVAYDFDYSGIVDAYYAVPDEKLNIKDVKQRIYRGPCRSEEQLSLMINDFISHRADLIGLIQDFEYLNEKTKKRMVDYLESFFDDCETGAVLRRIKRECIDYN